MAKFLLGVSYDQLWFTRPSGSNNLEISIIGTNDKLIIKDWYLGSQYRVEEIRTVDGSMLLTAAKVQDLVTVMASLTKPAIGQTTLSPAYQSQLASVFASTWTSADGQGLMAGGGGQTAFLAKGVLPLEPQQAEQVAGIMPGGCVPTPRQDRVADWLADIGDRANAGRIQAWLADHGYASFEEWLDLDARPELPFGHLLNRFRDRQDADTPTTSPAVEDASTGTPLATEYPWVVGGALPRPELVDHADGLATLSMREWLSTLEQNPQTGAEDLYRSLVEGYAAERTSQSNPVLDSIRFDQDRRADVASNYQRLVSAMSLAGANESGLSASCEAHRDRLNVESSLM